MQEIHFMCMHYTPYKQSRIQSNTVYIAQSSIFYTFKFH